jgi:hypothetical protein
MRKFVLQFTIATMLFSCGSDGSETEVVMVSVDASTDKLLYESIVMKHNSLLNNDGTANRLMATELYDMAVDYLDKFPDSDSRFEVMEYARAASAGADKFRNTDRILKMMIDEFPDHELRPEKMSLRAFTLWHLGDVEGSTKIYEQIIHEYPNSDWARDAEGSLRMNDLGTEDGKLPDYFEKPQ